MFEKDGPVHRLLDALEAERLAAIKDLTTHPANPLPPDLLHRLAELHLALAAVRDEIETHEIKVGYGGEKPLT